MKIGKVTVPGWVLVMLKPLIKKIALWGIRRFSEEMVEWIDELVLADLLKACKCATSPLAFAKAKPGLEFFKVGLTFKGIAGARGVLNLALTSDTIFKKSVSSAGIS